MIISLGKLKIWLDLSPQILFFLTFIALSIIILDQIAKRVRKKRVIHFGNFETLKRIEGKRRFYFSPWLFLFRFIILALLFMIATDSIRINIAKPVANADFIIAIDASSSMLERDFIPTRFDAAKTALISILKAMPVKSKVTLIRFGGRAEIVGSNYTNPLIVAAKIKNLKIMEEGGTAIGDAILTAATLVKNSNRTKIMILITDGENNKGVNVSFAAEEAAKRGIHIYTIGIVPDKKIAEEYEKTIENKEEKYKTYFKGSGADIKTLKKISEMTGGKTYIVDNARELKYELEKILVKSEYIPLNTQYYLIMAIIIASMLEIVLYAYFGVV